jgi:hypothetical protein
MWHMPSLKPSREPGNEHDECLATIETMKETFVIVQAIPHEEIRDSFCQNEARVKRVGKALIPISSRRDALPVRRINSNPILYRHSMDSVFRLTGLSEITMTGTRDVNRTGMD